jgi:hypothetical protein
MRNGFFNLARCLDRYLQSITNSIFQGRLAVFNSHQVKPMFLPLRRFVIKVTGDADEGNYEEIQKAIRRYHNRLANGTIPRSIFKKIGKELYVDLVGFKLWVNKDSKS